MSCFDIFCRYLVLVLETATGESTHITANALLGPSLLMEEAKQLETGLPDRQIHGGNTMHQALQEAKPLLEAMEEHSGR